MTVKVAINGYGRVGRNALRAAFVAMIYPMQHSVKSTLTDLRDVGLIKLLRH